MALRAGTVGLCAGNGWLNDRLGQADRRLKKSKPSYQRTNSQTFKMFDEAQIKEFKEIFGFLDQDGNSVIEVDDLVALHGIMGKPADEAALGAMIAEAPGPLDF